jgi:hypothetical protein
MPPGAGPCPPSHGPSPPREGSRTSSRLSSTHSSSRPGVVTSSQLSGPCSAFRPRYRRSSWPRDSCGANTAATSLRVPTCAAGRAGAEGRQARAGRGRALGRLAGGPSAAAACRGRHAPPSRLAVAREVQHTQRAQLAQLRGKGRADEVALVAAAEHEVHKPALREGRGGVSAPATARTEAATPHARMSESPTRLPVGAPGCCTRWAAARTCRPRAARWAPGRRPGGCRHPAGSRRQGSSLRRCGGRGCRQGRGGRPVGLPRLLHPRCMCASHAKPGLTLVVHGRHDRHLLRYQPRRVEHAEHLRSAAVMDLRLAAAWATQPRAHRAAPLPTKGRRLRPPHA